MKPVDQLAARICKKATNKPLLITVVGGPGAGKSTYAKRLRSALKKQDKKVLIVSTDDFYLTKHERQKAQLKWRGLPGTIDAKLFKHVMSDLLAGNKVVTVPRFDKATDDRLPSKKARGPFDICLLEGWMVRPLLQQAYPRRLPCRRFSIYLEKSVEELKARRFAREERLQQKFGPQAGFSPKKLQQFWNEALLPGIKHFVLPEKRRADHILHLPY